MGLMINYLQTTKNLEKFFKAIQNAQAPEQFTHKFLQQLGFTSTNDRLLIGVMKGLGFLNDNSEPTENYYKLLDKTQSKKILANAIREAYEDLFALNVKAYEYTNEEVKSKLKMLTQGQKSDNVLTCMVATFISLCELADWSETKASKSEKSDPEKAEIFHTDIFSKDNKISPTLHYNIQIHLPETRDPAVYDAIFQSLKKHLI